MIARDRFSALAGLAAALIAASGPVAALALPAAPRLTGFDTSGSETVGFAAPASPLFVPVTQVRLRFDLPLATQPGTGAESPSNFRLVAAGPDGVIATTACGAQAAGDDIGVNVLDVAWNAADNEATLHLDAPRGLARGRYRVLACDSLLGLGGLALDGDADGLPGGVAMRDWSIREGNAFDNPGLDASVDGWQALSLGLAPATLQRSALDADGASASGALRLVSPLPASGTLLGNVTCLAMTSITTSPTPAWRSRLRYRVLQGNVRIFVRAWFGFSGDGPGDSGCHGPGVQDETSFDASVSPLFATFDTGWRDAQLFPLATANVMVVARDGAPYEVLFDDLGFALDSQLIFRDDFHAP